MNARAESAEPLDLTSTIGLQTWLRTQIAAVIGCSPDEVAHEAQFADAGVTSLQMTAVVAALSQALRRPLSPTVAWAHPTIAALVSYLLTAAAVPQTPGSSPARRGACPTAPVAVVGIGCRMPGASGPDAFWRLLTAGADAVGDVPSGRWDAAQMTATAAGAAIPRQAGFLTERIDEFDALFFGISPREAQEIDPQQRLFLEVAWEALEDAGLADDRLAGSATGVFAGAIWNDFGALAARAAAATAHSATGRALNMVANRVSYAFGLRGPSMVFDSACSSSMLAVHYACESLRSGDSALALAGGVNLLLDPETMRTLTLFGGLSGDGRCKAFDAAGDGFGRGEGCGVVVLKLLSDALADGDDVWATIEGSAVNNDGSTNGLTAPSPLAQRAVLLAACERAGVAPAQIDFVETHGTGTALGDPIECEALGAVFGEGRARDRPLPIGAVKTNIGHLEAAAGIAGVIKTALCLRHGAIPPNLHFHEPNPFVAFDALGLRVPVELEPWPAGARRRAGVSSFGWGGTNVHIVMGGAAPPARPALPRPSAAPSATRPRVALVCSPHGHQWDGMGRLMMRTEPAFRAAFEQFDEAFAEHAGWSLAPALFADDHAAAGVDVVQPLLVAVQVGLAAWLEQAGLRPDVVVGHSLGEIAAAAIAGIIDVREAARIVHHYSAQQRRVAGSVGMVIAELAPDELRPLLVAYDGRVTVAAQNGPRSTNVVGPGRDLDALLATLRARQTLCAPIRVDVPAHSAAIDVVLDDLRTALDGMRTTPDRLPMISSVTGRELDWQDVDAGYFCRNLREPVRFADAMQHVLAGGCDVLLELSAHPVLLPALQQSVEASGRDVRLLATMRRGDDDRAAGLATLAELARLGALAESAPPREAAVILSAASPEALRAVARRLATQIESADEPAPVGDIAAVALRRRLLAHRLATVAGDPQQLAADLSAFAAGEPRGDIVTAERPSTASVPVAFVFPGQGSQWLGMGCELLRREPAFHAAVRACDAAAQPFLGWSILDELQASESASRLDRIDVVQPVLFCMQVGLARLWESWGLRPAAVVGHSMGEVAAAHVAGALTLDDAARILCRRSSLMARASGRGAMLATELSMNEAQAVVAGHEERVSVAVSNSSRSTVLSGDTAALEGIARDLEAQGAFHRWVRVDVASHSPQMDALRDDLLAELDGVGAVAGAIPIYSTVSGRIEDGSGLCAEYWVDNLRRPVLFGDQIARLLADGVSALVEISPHPILSPAIQQVAAERDVTAAVVPSLRRGEPELATLLRAAGQLRIEGAVVDLARTLRPGGRALKLPTYPWQRERLWPPTLEGGRPATRSAGRELAAVDLPGRRFDPPDEPGTHYWDSQIDMRSEGIGDHRIGGVVVVPGALYASLALAVAQETRPGARVTIADLAFWRRLVLEDCGARRVQLALVAGQDDARLQVYADAGAGMAVVAEATIVVESSRGPAGPPLDVGAIQQRMERRHDGNDYYRLLRDAGLDYGPAFRGIEQISVAGGEVLARLAPASGISTATLPPALLDAVLQTTLAPEIAASRPGEAPAAYVGEGIDELRVVGPVREAAWAHAVIVELAGRHLRADVRVTDAAGTPLVEVTGARFSALDGWTSDGERRNGAARLPRAAPADAARLDRRSPSVRAEIDALDGSDDRRATVEARVRECVGDVVRLPWDRIGADRPLRTLGVDSVMSLELRNRLERAFAVKLSATVVWNHPTVRELGSFLSEKLGIDEDDADVEREVELRPAAAANGDESARLALARELDELAGLMERL